MPIRKKLIVFKNYPTVLTTYVKRHQNFLKKHTVGQLCQSGFFSIHRRRYCADYLFHVATPGQLKPTQLEAVQKILVRKFARLFRLWMLIRFTGMVTSKPREIRMGKGKGAFAFWSRTVAIGFPLFEISFIKWFPIEYLYHIARRLRAKLPVQILVVGRRPNRAFQK
jgi:ribosomal protein L16/L10AE